MSRLRLLSLIILVLATIMILGSVPAAAVEQEEHDCSSNCVEGFSVILKSTTASEIDTFSETFVSLDLAADYNAYVNGFLFENGTQINAGCADGSASVPGCWIGPYRNDAYAQVASPLSVGNTYTLEGDHYLVAYHYYRDSNGNRVYYNPNLYSGFLGGGGYDPSGWNYTPSGGGSYYIYNELIYLGTTAAQISSDTPSISSISPSGAGMGANGPLTIEGSDLIDLFTRQATPNITGSGVSLSVNEQTESRVVLNYSIAQDAGRGPRSLTLSSRFGTSNPATFTVGDATPHVSSISPSDWDAGTTIPNVIITGTGFGSSPQLSISGSGVTLNSYSVTGVNQISASVTIDVAALDGSATVMVQSRGYNGSGFMPGNSGDSPNGNGFASVHAIRLPTPKILFHGQNVAGSASTSVFAGQMIALSTTSSGYSATYQQWSVQNQANITGGFTASSASGVEKADPTMTGVDNVTFYFVNPGTTETVTYSYCIDANHTVCTQATAPFKIYGPTPTGAGGAFFEVLSLGEVKVDPVGVARQGRAKNPWLEFGNISPQNGIVFQVTAGTPAGNAGAFQWVQLLAPRRSRYRTSPPTPDTNGGNGLDQGWYPYRTWSNTPNQTSDSPGIELSVSNVTGFAEAADYFQATMYLMWDPALLDSGESGCTPAYNTQDRATGAITQDTSHCTGSIPIPLGYMRWGYCGDAINTLIQQPSTSTTWIQSCAQPAKPTFQSATSYPEWQKEGY